METKIDCSFFKQHLVSVIVPVYNAAHSLQATIRSLTAQTYPNLEIILVDDASTDSSRAICTNEAKIDSRIRVIMNAVNAGVSASRNTGLEQSSGEYIFFCDADDVPEATIIQMLVEMISRDEQVDMSICSYYIDDAPAFPLDQKEVRMDRCAMAKAVASMGKPKIKGYVWNKMFKRSIIDLHGLKFDLQCSICEDSLFCHQYIQYCRSGIYKQIPLYHYRQNPESLVHRSIDERSMSVFASYAKITGICQQYEDQNLQKCIQANIQSYAIKYLYRIYREKEKSQYTNQLAAKLKGHFTEILFSLYIPYKRKIMAVILFLHHWI